MTNKQTLSLRDNPKTNSQWEDEFDNTFGNRFTYPCKAVYADFGERVSSLSYDIKQFISNLLHQRDMEIVKRLEGMKSGVRRNPTGLRTDTVMDDIEDAREEGYLLALTDAINEIKEKEK